MTKQTKPKDEPRRVGPKFARNVIPQSFQIRRPASPMAELLDEAGRGSRQGNAEASAEGTPVKLTPVKSTPVEKPGVVGVAASSEARRYPVSSKTAQAAALPKLDEFVDDILPRFPPARQAILLRLYRWCEGSEKEIVVSTPKLAANTNMDEKACRTHLHALIAEGFLMRSMDGEQIAKFGGSDRGSRGLILQFSGDALLELIK